jgi:hypothetical protein
MTILAVIVAIGLAFLVFRFIAGVVKFGLLALIIIVVLWFVVGAQHGSSMTLAGGLR